MIQIDEAEQDYSSDLETVTRNKKDLKVELKLAIQEYNKKKAAL